MPPLPGKISTVGTVVVTGTTVVGIGAVVTAGFEGGTTSGTVVVVDKAGTVVVVEVGAVVTSGFGTAAAIGTVVVVDVVGTIVVVVVDTSGFSGVTGATGATGVTGVTGVTGAGLNRLTTDLTASLVAIDSCVGVRSRVSRLKFSVSISSWVSISRYPIAWNSAAVNVQFSFAVPSAQINNFDNALTSACTSATESVNSADIVAKY
jgi:hypothetical protein